MNISPVTRLTARWLDTADHQIAIAARHDLVKHLKSPGNTQDQIDHWLSYAPEMTAREGETPAEVIETEAHARMQGQIRSNNETRRPPVLRYNRPIGDAAILSWPAPA